MKIYSGPVDAGSAWHTIGDVSMRSFLKALMNGLCRVAISPVYLIVALCQSLSGSEDAFLFFAQIYSRCCGKPGEYIRRAYYRWTLRRVGENLVVGFGSFFTHREVTAGDGVWIGQYAVIGRIDIGSNVLIGDHSSIPSGRHQHRYDGNGMLIHSGEEPAVLSIGSNSWIGVGCVVLADIGEGSIVGAGSVVVKEIEPFSVAAGNPAATIRKREGGRD